MSKIATKGICNFIESGGIYSGSFLGGLISECPTYKEIIGTDKFIVNGTYENNQLVKESDITKYTGKTKNYSFIWGEYDLTKTEQTPVINRICNVKIKQNFLNAPDTNLTITITLKLFYKNIPTSNVVSSVTENVTVNFTQTNTNNKNYAYTQDFAIKFGHNPKASFESIEIINVTITPNSTSQYEYITNIKDITQNYFVNTLSIASTDFYIDSYNDNVSEKIISGSCRIVPEFNIPTGENIKDIIVSVDEYNFSESSSIDLTYNTSFNYITYKFNTYDMYGERGYKLPYLYAKFNIKHIPSSNMSYVYALWEPNSTNTGIELTSLILNE